MLTGGEGGHVLTVTSSDAAIDAVGTSWALFTVLHKKICRNLHEWSSECHTQMASMSLAGRALILKSGHHLHERCKEGRGGVQFAREVITHLHERSSEQLTAMAIRVTLANDPQ